MSVASAALISTTILKRLTANDPPPRRPNLHRHLRRVRCAGYSRWRELEEGSEAVSLLGVYILGNFMGIYVGIELAKYLGSK